MNKFTSVYLDLIRFSAAIMVVLSHAAYTRLGGEWLSIFGSTGRDAVMIFFVLSGYVIAFVVHTKERDFRSYSISRLSRIYSVALPAIVLTVILDSMGKYLDPQFYSGGWYIDSYAFLRFLASATLANEYWFVSIRAFSNGPFWSLSYEFAYYLLFALWLFSPEKLRLWLVVLASAIIGPKILLLAPVWLAGVYCYHFNQRYTPSIVISTLLFASSLVAYGLFKYFDIAIWLLEFSRELLGPEFVDGQLKYSRFFLSSYILTFIVCINFIGANGLGQSGLRFLPILEKLIVYAAGYTFTAYLLHYPLLHTSYAATKSSVASLVLTGIAVWLIGNVTEKKKHVWKHYFTALWQQTEKLIHSKR